jgi:hypothetical protein
MVDAQRDQHFSFRRILYFVNLDDHLLDRLSGSGFSVQG